MKKRRDDKGKDIHAQALGRKRWKDVTPEERSRLMTEAIKKRHGVTDPKVRTELAALASHAYWDSMTPEQRSAEMKRRAKVRTQNRKRDE
jgi:hypothetical protein